MKKGLIYIIILLLLLIILQIIKCFFLGTFTVNSGLLGSILTEYSYVPIVVNVTCIVLLALLLVRYKDLGLGRYMILLIITGCLSNLIDRLFFGGVVDFIKVGKLYIFNLADILIFLSTSVFIFYSFLRVITHVK